MIVKYKNILEKINYFEWVKFLEKVNPKEISFAIAEKLDSSTKRNDLSYYKDYLLYDNGQNFCFYCRKLITKKSAQIDHYIPWSFTKDDKLWNFVLCCKECNNEKRDILAEEFYTEQLLKRNMEIMKNNLNFTLEIDFESYKDEKILLMYKAAIFNGFDFGWKPSRISEI